MMTAYPSGYAEYHITISHHYLAKPKEIETRKTTKRFLGMSELISTKRT